jgi:hypothetical protein
MIPVKTHQMPGDVPKSEKIAMLEGKHVDRKRGRAFRKGLKARERAVLKERTRREINASV